MRRTDFGGRSCGDCGGCMRCQSLYEACRLRSRHVGKGRNKMIKTTLEIDGMMCGMCESHINDCLRRNFNVKKVSSSHAKGETVIISETAPDEEMLKKVIAQTGYELKGIRSEPAPEKTGLFGLFRKK